MTRTINRLSDRLLTRFAPKATASACLCSAEYYCVNTGTAGFPKHKWCSNNCNCVPSCGPETSGSC